MPGTYQRTLPLSYSVLMVLAFIGVAALGLVLIVKPKASTKSRLIPSPPGLPWIGNVSDVPREKQWLGWNRLKEVYGDIARLKIFGTDLILLSSPEYIHQILEKGSSSSSDRASLPMLGELVGFNKTIVLLQPGPEFRAMRKYFHQTIGGDSVQMYRSLVEEECVRFLRRIVNTNGGPGLQDEIRVMTAAIVLGMLYAIPVEGANDPYVVDLAGVMANFASAGGKIHLVNIFPFLKYLPEWAPGAGWKREARQMREELFRACERPYQRVTMELDSNTFKNSFSHELLNDPDLPEEQRQIVKWAAISMYLSSSDTTVAAVQNFFLQMMLNPEIQRKAREEVLSVVGTERLPTIRDRPSLPFLDAILKEVLRYSPIAPIGGGHVLSQDEVIDEYVLRKGSVVCGNIWGLLNDEKYFSNPRKFVPERHLGKDNTTNETALLDPLDYVWGFGRRVCPGRSLADLELWTTMGCTLATMEILKPLDEEGNEREITPDWTNGMFSHCVPFDCRIRYLNDQTIVLLQE